MATWTSWSTRMATRPRRRTPSCSTRPSSSRSLAREAVLMRLDPRSGMFSRPLRLALAGLWVAGACLAGMTAILSFTHHLDQAIPYAVITVLLVLMAIYTARGQRVALMVGLAICALQPIAAIAAGWEL